MRRLFCIIIIAALSATVGWSQSTPISGQVISQYGQPVAGAQVYICSAAGSSGLPCSPLAAIYLDYNLTVPTSNPTQTDANGNFNVYAGSLPSPNVYVVNEVPQAGTIYTQLFPGAVSGGSGTVSGQTPQTIPQATGPSAITTSTGISLASSGATQVVTFPGFLAANGLPTSGHLQDWVNSEIASNPAPSGNLVLQLNPVVQAPYILTAPLVRQRGVTLDCNGAWVDWQGPWGSANSVTGAISPTGPFIDASPGGENAANAHRSMMKNCIITNHGNFSFVDTDGSGNPNLTFGELIGGDPNGVLTPSNWIGANDEFANNFFYGFNTAIAPGNNAFLWAITSQLFFTTSAIGNNLNNLGIGTLFPCAGGQSGSGENLKISGSSISNAAGTNITNNCGQEVNLSETSVDYGRHSGQASWYSTVFEGLWQPYSFPVYACEICGVNTKTTMLGGHIEHFSGSLWRGGGPGQFVQTGGVSSFQARGLQLGILSCAVVDNNDIRVILAGNPYGPFPSVGDKFEVTGSTGCQVGITTPGVSVVPFTVTTVVRGQATNTITASTTVSLGSASAKQITPITSSQITNVGTFTGVTVANASGGNTVYTGSFPSAGSNAYATYVVLFTACGQKVNNGTFTISASSTTTLTVNNAAGVTDSGCTATINLATITAANSFAANDSVVVAGGLGTTGKILSGTNGTTYTVSATGLSGAQFEVPTSQTISPASAESASPQTAFAGLADQSSTTGTFAITSVNNASAGSTVYNGTFANGGANAYANFLVCFSGFAVKANNGCFIISASTTSTITVNNAAGVSDTTGTATIAAASTYTAGFSQPTACAVTAVQNNTPSFTVTAFSSASNLVTFTSTTTAQPGQKVMATNLTGNATYLNNQILVIVNNFGTTWTAYFNHADTSGTITGTFNGVSWMATYTAANSYAAGYEITPTSSACLELNGANIPVGSNLFSNPTYTTSGTTIYSDLLSVGVMEQATSTSCTITGNVATIWAKNSYGIGETFTAAGFIAPCDGLNTGTYTITAQNQNWVQVSLTHADGGSYQNPNAILYPVNHSSSETSAVLNVATEPGWYTPINGTQGIIDSRGTVFKQLHPVKLYCNLNFATPSLCSIQSEQGFNANSTAPSISVNVDGSVNVQMAATSGIVQPLIGECPNIPNPGSSVCQVWMGISATQGSGWTFHPAIAGDYTSLDMDGKEMVRVNASAAADSAIIDSTGLKLANTTATHILGTDNTNHVANVTLGSGLTYSGGILNTVVTPPTATAWATLFASTCNSGNALQQQLASDVGDGGSWWFCNFVNYDNAYKWAPVNGQLTLDVDVIPVAIAPTGTMANNGAITLGTALNATYPQIYLCLPASAIVAGSAVGCYYAVMSSATAGTVYNNPLFTTVSALSGLSGPYQWVLDGSTATDCTSGGGAKVVLCHFVSSAWSASAYSPTTPVPASPTAFVTTGPGAYTGSTSNIAMRAYNVQGNLMGTRGSVDTQSEWTNNNSAGAKVGNVTWSAAPASPYTLNASFSNTTNTGNQLVWRIKNLTTNSQINYTSATGSGPSTMTTKTVDSTQTTTVLLWGSIATATDYLISNGMTVKLVKP